MSLADKKTTLITNNAIITDNIQKVYDAGYEKGKGEGGGENKVAQIAEKTITEITAEDLKDVITIGRYSFYYCHNLEKVTIPDSVKTIEEQAFASAGLRTIEFGKGLQKIDRLAFSYSGLKSVVIPDSVTQMGGSVFYCSGLENAKIGNGLSYSLPEGTFSWCSQLKEVEIPNTIERIGFNCFSTCSSLESIKLPHYLKIIEYSAFSSSGLKSVEIPTGVEEIEREAFNYCNQLKNIVIFPYLAVQDLTIGSNAFGNYYGDELRTFYVNLYSPPILEGELTNIDKLGKIYVPVGRGNAYKTATNWANYADYIEEITE